MTLLVSTVTAGGAADIDEKAFLVEFVMEEFLLISVLLVVLVVRFVVWLIELSKFAGSPGRLGNPGIFVVVVELGANRLASVSCLA